MPPGPRRATLWSLGLLALVLALLAVGGALRLDDGSGRGWMRTSWLFVDLAAVVGVLGAVVAARSPEARRPFGLALVALAAAIGVLAATVDGFRIVWHAGEAELLVVVALLLLGASLFLVPEHPPPPTVRVALYAVALVVAVLVGARLGDDHFARTECADNSYGDCDLGFAESVAWAFAAAASTTAWCGAVELVVGLRRPTGHDAALGRTGPGPRP